MFWIKSKVDEWEINFSNFQFNIIWICLNNREYIKADCGSERKNLTLNGKLFSRVFLFIIILFIHTLRLVLGVTRKWRRKELKLRCWVFPGRGGKSPELATSHDSIKSLFLCEILLFVTCVFKYYSLIIGFASFIKELKVKVWILTSSFQTLLWILTKCV